MTTQMCADDWREIATKAQRETAQWRENFAVLQRALVGETGASGITVAHQLRKDADLLAWVLAHPETAAECLEDAASGDGTARSNLERRIAGLTQATAGGRLGAA